MIGEHIKRIRKEKHMTLSELAERSGFAKSYVSSIERNRQTNPSIQFLENISKELDVSLTYLLYGKENDRVLDKGWENLIQEAQNLGVSKEQFREYLEFNKWQDEQKSNM
ncbi:helix-turn-helix domain-containing protein [Halobacillus shinanisalinarum]|uniref:Helix-turn-helix domain-containing protein n=1 Tax=Halobacillus shinanisalinarum TaxID=2932258 RepID=A0ABY4H3B2_9BACI|nr:helix-turn-helix domain-containing protein [Halobacillus shinanisalinarum]UOQ94913.1 helix-turn-helix domain-containing protein [Halobacillus shinanisalinarum]